MKIESLYWDEVKNPKCTACALHQLSKRVCSATGRGNILSKVLFVGEAPGETEELRGKPFVGKSGQLLEQLLQEAEWDVNYTVTNSVWCRPPNSRTPKAAELKACSKIHLYEVIRKQNPSLIVCLGGIALKSVVGKYNASLKKSRRKVLKRHFPVIAKNGKDVGMASLREIPIVCTYHPNSVLRSPSLRQVVIEDLRSFMDVLKGKTLKDNPDEKFYAYGVEDLDSWNFRTGDDLAFDLETNTLSPFAPEAKILAFGVSQAPLQSFSFTPNCAVARKVLTDALTNKRVTKVGHNLKFDLLWMRRQGFKVSGPLFDTMVAYHLLDEEYPDKSLEHLALRFTTIGNYGEGIKENREKDGFMESLPKEELLSYVGADADATFRLKTIFQRRLRDEGLYTVFKHTMKTLRVLTEVELAGIRVDENVLDFETTETLDKATELRSRLKKAHPNINWNSSGQVAHILYDVYKIPTRRLTKMGRNSADEKALQSALKRARKESQRRVIQDLLDLRGVATLLKTFLVPLREKHLCYSDGKVHPTYNLTGTVTGRLSCNNPNFQNIPQNLRRIFRSKWKNGVILQADFSQMELRILAHLSQEPAMLRVFHEDGDIHKLTASKIYGKLEKDVTKEERYLAKTVNFGVVYGMEAGRLSSETGMSFPEADKFLDDWKRAYPHVRKYMAKVRRECLLYHKVTDMFGRVRRLPIIDPQSRLGAHTLRQAGNFPVQGPAGFLTLLCMNRIFDMLRGMKSKIVGTVHDSIVFDCPLSEAALVEGIVTEICETPDTKDFGFELTVPLKIDIGIGPNWGELK